MSLITLRFSARAHGCVAGLLLLVPLLLGADDYLREIEEEAKRQAASLMIGPSPPAPMLGTAAVDDSTDRLIAGLDQATFEQVLSENLPGTYAFYQRLGPDQRKQVYETYQSDNRFANISEQVARLLNGKY